MRRFLFENSLSLFFGALFVLTLTAQSLAGQRVVSAAGSNESKPPGETGLESDRKQKLGGYAPEDAPRWAKARGWRTAVYQHSLVLVMLALFVGSWLAQSATAWRAFNAEQREHDEATVGWAGHVASANFWERTLQNWQSEFLAVGTMAVFTIYLRQRGSPESKPVGSPHPETGTSG